MMPIRPAHVQSVVNEMQLAALEEIIARSESSYVQVGETLDRMRQLFVSANQFEEHCNKIWGWSKSTIYEKIQAAAIANRVRIFGKAPPTKECAMALGKLVVTDQKPMWRQMIASGPERMTAAYVYDKVEEKLGRPLNALPGEMGLDVRSVFAALSGAGKLAVIRKAEAAALAAGEHSQQDPATNGNLRSTIDAVIRLAARMFRLAKQAGMKPETVQSKVASWIEQESGRLLDREQ